MKSFGLIGHKLEHSFSASYFEKKFANAGINATYSNLALNNISEVEKLKLAAEFSGLNVTIPYKQSIIPFLDEVVGEAKEIGAVNTIKIREGKWYGYNSDAFGFKQMIGPFLEGHQHKALILGTGGASLAVAFVLEKIGLEVNFLTRNPKLKNHYSYSDVNEKMIQFHPVIINTTPVGMYPDIKACMDLPFQAMSSNHLVIDLIYNPERTVFLEKAHLNGARILNGQTMLEQQAEKSWEIWNS